MTKAQLEARNEKLEAENTRLRLLGGLVKFREWGSDKAYVTMPVPRIMKSAVEEWARQAASQSCGDGDLVRDNNGIRTFNLRMKDFECEFGPDKPEFLIQYSYEQHTGTELEGVWILVPVEG